MGELVFVKKEIPFTDSLIIAEGAGLQHLSIMKMIKRKKTYLEAFGPIKFMDMKSINPLGGRPTKYCLLNEQQTTLLITFLDNTPQVTEFKTELVKQFFAMKNVLLEKKTETWQQSRAIGISQRKSETDVIKEFVEYAKENGSGSADKYYIHFSKLANKVCGISDRNLASVFQLNNLTLVERMIMITIQNGLIANIPYKDIYKNCKKQVELFGEVTYLEEAI